MAGGATSRSSTSATTSGVRSASTCRFPRGRHGQSVTKWLSRSPRHRRARGPSTSHALMTINQRALPMITSTVVGIAVLSVDIAINASHPGDHLDLRSPRLRPFRGIARFTAARDNPPRRAVGECTPGRGDKAIGLRYGSKHGSDWDCWTVWLRTVWPRLFPPTRRNRAGPRIQPGTGTGESA